ncbi:hypothetical protein HOY80DRAFT_1141162 [Tuber brumale]|nr:hypothetical protein HOY80DRAFT_1141162 [Tuber brumale]
MSNEIVNVMVFPTSDLIPLPPHPNSFYFPLSDKAHRAAKNLRTLYQLINQICPHGHGHYASFPDVKDNLPENYSAKLSCTGDGTSWRVAMGPEGVKGMAWYFCGAKNLNGMFKTAVIKYWNSGQCEAFVEALEIGGLQNLPINWRFAAQHNQVADASEDLHTDFAALTIMPQEENKSATEVGNSHNTAEDEQEKSVDGL